MFSLGISICDVEIGIVLEVNVFCSMRLLDCFPDYLLT